MGGRRRGECLAAVLVSAWLGAAGAAHAAEGSHTATLTRTSFDEYLQERKLQERPCLVMFHVNWCKVCQRTFPKFENASGLIYEKGVKMDFAHVDCTDDKTLCQRFNVKGYPTIKFFSPDDTEPMSYRGQRTEEYFLKYAQRMTRPAVLSVTGAALNAALADETLAAFFAADASEERPAGLLAAAKRWQDLHVFAAAPRLADLLPPTLKPPKGATLAVCSWGEQQWRGADRSVGAEPVAAFYTGSLDDVEAVTKWVQQNRFPGIWSLDASNFYFFTHANRSGAMVALDTANVSKAHEEGVRTAASRLGDKYIFGVVDGVSWADELADFNVAKQDLPRVLVVEDDFDKWVEDVEALRFDSLERDLRSLAEGAQLLRQDRSTVSKLLFWKRESLRYAVKARAYAERGPMQAASVALACLLALALLGGLGYCVMSCCRIMFADDPEWEEAAASQAARTQGRADRAKKD